MNDQRFKWILYTIILVIVTTIGIQVYWNYKNYQTNKQQLINDVQTSLDKAVDDYYAALAERTTVGIFLEGDQQKNPLKEGGKIDKFIQSIDNNKNEFRDVDSLDINDIEGITVLKGFKVDSMSNLRNKMHQTTSKASFKKRIDSLRATNIEFDMNSIEMLTSKIVISISNDTLNINEIDSLLNADLTRKNINLESQLKFYESDITEKLNHSNDSLFIDNKTLTHQLPLRTTSKSTFLPKGSKLLINFSDETLLVLKRGLSGILISSLLVIAVISCLFYLLKIIKHQKQLAEVKNDLISNITHEFKTPIATIGVALESINSFNAIEDIEKTKKYINMSSEQLSKLNIMVEKLLETATLDSDNLELNKESIDIVELLTTLINGYKIQFPKKEFNTSFKVKDLVAKVDIFHFENALNNILDNAVKYGGNLISVDVTTKDKSVDILISDNGMGLTKSNKDQIFEKFYRVPKGNTHDIKGFGIGLYYTKSIIDKHDGSIALELNKNLTTFKITIPNG